MNFEKIKSAIIDAAKLHGVEEYEIYYMSDESLSVETLKDEISSFSSGTSGGLCFRCAIDGKMGYASTEYIVPEEMERLVLCAKENAKSIEKDDICGIFKGSDAYSKNTANKYVKPTAAEIKQAALDIQRENYAADERVTEGTQSAAMTFGVTVRLFNSHGLDLMNFVGTSLVYAAPIVKVGEESESNYEIAKYTKDIDAKAIASKAVADSLEKIGAGEVPSGKYNIIISGDEMRGFLSAFSPAFSAKNAQLGLSLLAGKEGEKVAADIVTLTDDPMRKGYDIVTPFDAEGVATYRKAIIENGVLKTLLHNRETAAKANVESTGNASKAGYSAPVGISPYAFCIEAGKLTRDELFEKAGNGIFITEIKGIHAGADSVTGDFSLESAGFIIENGKKTKPVKSFTIAGNFFDLLKSIDSLSNNIETGVPTGFTSFASPDVLIKNMSVAGK